MATRAATQDAQRLLDLLNALGSTTFRQFLWQLSSDHDLTYAQSQVLFHVADHTGCHIGDVAKAFGVTLPAITSIVDRLEGKGFVQREDDPHDRRVCALAPTRRGRALADELRATRIRSLEKVVRGMRADDRHSVIVGLERLVAAAEAEAYARNGRRS